MYSYNPYCINLNRTFDFCDQMIKICHDNQAIAINPTSFGFYSNISRFENKEKFLMSVGFTKEIITKDIANSISIQKTVGRIPTHTDRTRIVTLLCPIYCLADTVFFETTEDFSNKIIYDKYGDIVPGKMFNEKMLIEKDRFRFPLGSWNLFNNQLPHCVENLMYNYRISIVVDLSSYYKTFDDAYNDIENLTKLVFQQ